MISFHYLLTSLKERQPIDSQELYRANDKLLRPHSETTRFESIDWTQDLRVQFKRFSVRSQEYCMRDNITDDVREFLFRMRQQSSERIFVNGRHFDIGR